MNGDAVYTDQTDLFDPSQFSWPVHLIGLGGIGSAVVLPLVKLGIRTELHLWDDDTVEPHNLPAQLIYRRQDLGQPKVEAIAEILDSYREPQLQIIPHRERVDSTTAGFEGIVISGVDSMESRAAIWEVLRFNPLVPLYMDGRIGGELCQLFSVNPCDADAGEFYEAWLFDDDAGAPLPCAARTIIHPPVLLAARIVSQLSRFARGLPTKAKIDDNVLHSATQATDD